MNLRGLFVLRDQKWSLFLYRVHSKKVLFTLEEFIMKKNKGILGFAVVLLVVLLGSLIYNILQNCYKKYFISKK